MQATRDLSAPSPRQPEALLRLPEVERITGLKKSSIYAGMKAGTFPKCVHIGPRAVAWPQSRIEAWQSRVLERSA
jgi:prophage regulatory protein